jgi:hypothetical protein
VRLLYEVVSLIRLSLICFLNADSAGRKRTIIKMVVQLILNGEIMMISMSFSGKLIS